MAAAIVLLTLAASGCGSGPGHGSADPRILSAEELKRMLVRAESGEALTLAHVWATWCPPCREEFPSLVRFQKEYRGRGVRVVLISADAPGKKEQVMNYLAGQGATFPSYIIANPDAAFIGVLCTNWSGALPASFFFGPGGELLRWWEGSAEYERYRETAETLLKAENKRR